MRGINIVAPHAGFNALVSHKSPALAAYTSRRKYGKDIFQRIAAGSGIGSGAAGAGGAKLRISPPPKSGTARHKNALAAMMGKI